MRDDRETSWMKATIGATIIGGGFWYAWAADKAERAKIDAGLCEARLEALYQPPPTYSNYGSAERPVMVPDQPDPYLRTLWQCQDGTQFWRRSGQ